MKDASFLWGELTSVRLAALIYLHNAHNRALHKLLYIALVLLYANVKRSVWRPLIYHSASHTRVFPWATFTHHRSIRFIVYTLVYRVHYIYIYIYCTTRFDTLACRLMFNTTANDRNETRSYSAYRARSPFINRTEHYQFRKIPGKPNLYPFLMKQQVSSSLGCVSCAIAVWVWVYG